MCTEMDDREFWALLDRLAGESVVVIDRPRGCRHPQYPNCVYPLDYGYLKDTTSMDGGGIDVWRGSAPELGLTAVLCTVDIMKRDSEIKLLLGCTAEESAVVYRFHNETDFMKGLLLARPATFDK